MPKGKGTRCPRKRKSSTVADTVFENPNMTSPSSSSALSTLSQPPTPIVTVSQVNRAISQTNAQFSGLPTPGRFLYGSAPYFDYQGYQPPSPFSQHPGAYPSTPPMPGAMPPLPFTLCKIIGNISICDGCRNRYSKHPNPPDDLCIRHQEFRKFHSLALETLTTTSVLLV